MNTETGDVVHHDFGNKIAGEAVFIPRGTNGEDDGYLAIYAFNQENQTSDLVLLDAARIDADPVAVVRLPATRAAGGCTATGFQKRRGIAMTPAQENTAKSCLLGAENDTMTFPRDRPDLDSSRL